MNDKQVQFLFYIYSQSVVDGTEIDFHSIITFFVENFTLTQLLKKCGYMFMIGRYTKIFFFIHNLSSYLFSGNNNPVDDGDYHAFIQYKYEESKYNTTTKKNERKYYDNTVTKRKIWPNHAIYYIDDGIL